jgi:hypothetical protein
MGLLDMVSTPVCGYAKKYSKPGVSFQCDIKQIHMTGYNMMSQGTC